MGIKEGIEAVDEDNVFKFEAMVEEGSEPEIRQELLEAGCKVVTSIDTSEGVKLSVKEQ